MTANWRKSDVEAVDKCARVWMPNTLICEVTIVGNGTASNMQLPCVSFDLTCKCKEHVWRPQDGPVHTLGACASCWHFVRAGSITISISPAVSPAVLRNTVSSTLYPANNVTKTVVRATVSPKLYRQQLHQNCPKN
eukprot:210813-Pelagomonas_calceolata.AAC.4